MFRFPFRALGVGLQTRTLTAVALSLCALGVVALSADAQSVPIGGQGQLQQAMLQNPDQIRQRIRDSGLTPDQIRARLRASGYPENLLDSYMGTTTGPTSGQPAPNELSHEPPWRTPGPPTGPVNLPEASLVPHDRLVDATLHQGTDPCPTESVARPVADAIRIPEHAGHRAGRHGKIAAANEHMQGQPMLAQKVVADRAPYGGRIRRACPDGVENRNLFRKRDLQNEGRGKPVFSSS